MRAIACGCVAAWTTVVVATAARAATPSAIAPSPSPPGVGSALGSVAGIVVLALLALGFLWVRSRSLRR
jgi:hypothetical protein